MTLFNAAPLARRWLSVAAASSKDNPALDRTVCLEQFHEGLRITATDGYLLLTTFVPNVDHHDADAPAVDAAPYATAVAMDPHGRARGLLGHALGLVAQAERAEDPEPVELSVRLGVIDELTEDERTSFAGMDPTWVVVELPDRERVKLRVYEGEFPSWRAVMAGFSAARTGAVALGHARVEQLAKLAKYQDDLDPLRFEFGGQSAAVRLTVDKTLITGLVMPVSWDFDLDAPRTDDTDPTGPED